MKVRGTLLTNALTNTLTSASTLALSLAILAMAGCGGGDKKVEQPVDPDPELDVDSEPDASEGMEDPEVLDAIQRTFARKQTILGRCFTVGVEAGEMKKTARGFITIGATISPSGQATDVRILKASLSSKSLQACVKQMVGTWAFPEPQAPVETSFMYTMERL